MAQDISILPECIQPVILKSIEAVGCQGSLDCACHNLIFLNHFAEAVATSSCGTSDQALAIFSGRELCATANPSLNDNRSTAVCAVYIVFGTLAITAVLLRFYSRRLIGTRVGWDDWFAVAALVAAWGTDALTLVNLNDGLGRHDFMLDPVPSAAQTGLAVGWICSTANAFVRLSIIALYARLFSSVRNFKKILIVSGVIVVVVPLMLALLFTFSCQPVAYMWNKDIQGGRCLSMISIFAALAAVDAATGIWLLLLPIPIIQTLHLSRGRKCGIIALFSIGTIVCVGAILRVPFILKVNPLDVNWTMVPFSIFGGFEVNLAVVSVCLPTMAPMFKEFWPRLSSSIRSISSLRSRSGRRSHSKPSTGRTMVAEDETPIYTGNVLGHVNKTDTRVEVAERDESWPMTAIGVTREVEVERDASLASKHRIEQV
ncbi:MAG: hypothetical protein Q9218_003116 [Villophora microphyllina]